MRRGCKEFNCFCSLDWQLVAILKGSSVPPAAALQTFQTAWTTTANFQTRKSMLFSFRSSSLNLHNPRIPPPWPTLTSGGGSSAPQRVCLHVETGRLTKQTHCLESLTDKKAVALLTCVTLVAVIALIQWNRLTDSKALVDVETGAPSSERLAFKRGLLFEYLFYEQHQRQHSLIVLLTDRTERTDKTDNSNKNYNYMYLIHPLEFLFMAQHISQISK